MMTMIPAHMMNEERMATSDARYGTTPLTMMTDVISAMTNRDSDIDNAVLSGFLMISVLFFFDGNNIVQRELSDDKEDGEHAKHDTGEYT